MENRKWEVPLMPMGSFSGDPLAPSTLHYRQICYCSKEAYRLAPWHNMKKKKKKKKKENRILYLIQKRK